VLDTLPQLIEGAHGTSLQGAPVRRRLDATGISFEQPHAEDMLDIRNRLRHRRLRDGEAVRCLAHAAKLGDCNKDMQVMELEPAPNAFVPFHGSELFFYAVFGSLSAQRFALHGRKRWPVWLRGSASSPQRF